MTAAEYAEAAHRLLRTGAAAADPINAAIGYALLALYEQNREADERIKAEGTVHALLTEPARPVGLDIRTRDVPTSGQQGIQ